MPKPTNESYIKIIKKRFAKIAKKKKAGFLVCHSTPASEKSRDDFQDLIDKMCEEDPEFKKLWEEEDDA